MSFVTTSALDEEPYVSKVKEWIRAGEFNWTIAKKLKSEYNLEISESSVRRFRKRHGLGIPTREQPSVKVDGDEATVVTPMTTAIRAKDGNVWVQIDQPDFAKLNIVGEHDLGKEFELSHDTESAAETSADSRLNDPDSMLRERGLDPEDWSIEGVTVNEWDGPTAEGTTVTYKQAKLQLRRKKPEFAIVPARADGWKPSRDYLRTVSTTEFKTVVLIGDQQAPFHDRKLHELFSAWLKFNQPDEGVLIGDTVDFPDISRHRDNPDNVASVNDCIQSGYEILRDYVAASEGTQWTKLIGNHDERIRNFVIDQAKALYGIKRATTSDQLDEKVLDVGYLLRLDELGIELVDPKGGYSNAQVSIDDAIAVRHGWLTRKGSGATALASLEALGYNIVVGHTHRQSLVQKTLHNIDGSTKTVYGVEAGCMCSMNGEEVEGRRFPDYTIAPDWQQGFAVATVYRDGTTNIELATYRDGSLFYRDQRFS